MIDDATDTQTTGALPELTERDRRRAVPDVSAAAPGGSLVLEDRGETVQLPLTKGITHIGRGISCDLTIEDAAVSRRHALIVRRGDGYVVLDDRSRNGTFVNDERVAEATLRDGDVITIGAVAIRFVLR